MTGSVHLKPTCVTSLHAQSGVFFNLQSIVLVHEPIQVLHPLNTTFAQIRQQVQIKHLNVPLHPAVGLVDLDDRSVDLADTGIRQSAERRLGSNDAIAGNINRREVLGLALNTLVSIVTFSSTLRLTL